MLTSTALSIPPTVAVLTQIVPVVVAEDCSALTARPAVPGTVVQLQPSSSLSTTPRPIAVIVRAPSSTRIAAAASCACDNASAHRCDRAGAVVDADEGGGRVADSLFAGLGVGAVACKDEPPGGARTDHSAVVVEEGHEPLGTADVRLRRRRRRQREHTGQHETLHSFFNSACKKSTTRSNGSKPKALAIDGRKLLLALMS